MQKSALLLLLLLSSGCARLTGVDRIPDETRTQSFPPLQPASYAGKLPTPLPPKPTLDPATAREQAADAAFRAMGAKAPAVRATPGDAALLRAINNGASPAPQPVVEAEPSLLERWLGVRATHDPVLKP